MKAREWVGCALAAAVSLAGCDLQMVPAQAGQGGGMGGQQPGGQQPGGQRPGGPPPGGQMPGGQQPGGQQPGGQQPGGQQPGGQQPGGQQPGGQQPGGQQPGGQQPGGQPPGSQQPGGPSPGNQQPGGQDPGGQDPGGQDPGAQQPGDAGDDCLADAFMDVSDTEGPGGNYGRPELSASCDDDALVVRSNGLPHFRYVAVTPNDLAAQSYEWRIPRHPAVADASTDIPLLGVAAVAVDGIPIFGPNEAQMPHPYGDPIANSIMDFCLGHVGAQGMYHFHGLLVDCFFPDADEEAPSPIVGVALDGFPIYGPVECADADCQHTVRLESGWENVGAESVGCVDSTDCNDGFTCALAIVDGVKQNACVPQTYAWDNNEFVPKDDPKYLDQCNGHVGPDGTYHYHATDTFPYILGCYRGTPVGAGAGQPGGGQQPPNGGGQQPPSGGMQPPKGGMQPPGGGGQQPPNGGGQQPPNGGGQQPPNGGMQPPGGGGQQPPNGGMGAPPAEAIAACDGASEGDACDFDARDGRNVQGACRTIQGQLACAPAR